VIKRLGIIALATLICVASMISVPTAQAAPIQQSGPTFGQAFVAGDYIVSLVLPLDIMSTYPEGAPGLVALLPVQGLPNSSEISVQWLKDEKPNGDLFTLKTDAKTIRAVSYLTPPGGMTSGNWEAQFSYRAKVVGSAKAKVARTFIVYPFRFGEYYTRISKEIINLHSTFPVGTRQIVAGYKYYFAPEGAKGQAQWFYNDQPILSFDITFDGTSGNGFAVLNKNNNEGLPEGTYELRIVVDGQTLQTSRVKIAATASAPTAAATQAK
jgi:hypothetical protein